jgi:hypothetical protein
MKINLTHQFLSIKGVPVISDQHSISFTSSYTLTTLSLEERTTKRFRSKTSGIQKKLCRGVHLYPHDDQGRTSKPMPK